jgi:hypothetical protein
MKDVIEWLLEGEPFVEYRTRVDLLDQSEDELKVAQSRKRMIEDPRIQSLLNELKNWPGTVLSSHKSASQPFHKLSFIADIGLRKDEPEINIIIEKLFEHVSDEGPFQLPTNIPKHFGGSGKNEWAWALCDAPIIIYSLAKFGLRNDPQVQKAVEYLVNLAHENGWRCVVSKELGKFRGPGRKDDTCPYATLVMLQMLAQFDEWRHSNEAYVGAELLLDLWKRSKELHPYMFFMGTDFRKIKAPFIWYDILHVLDVLSQFNWTRTDSRLIEMSETVKQKSDAEGKYTPESVWRAWKEWDFGQKKQPSRWLTFLVLNIFRRLNKNNNLWTTH